MSTEWNRVLPALRVPSRLTIGCANIAQERKIVLRVLSARAFSHGQGQGQSRITGFNARNLCPQTTQLLPWFRRESSFTLSAKRNADQDVGEARSHSRKV